MKTKMVSGVDVLIDVARFSVQNTSKSHGAHQRISLSGMCPRHAVVWSTRDTQEAGGTVDFPEITWFRDGASAISHEPVGIAC